MIGTGCPRAAGERAVSAKRRRRLLTLGASRRSPLPVKLFVWAGGERGFLADQREAAQAGLPRGANCLRGVNCRVETQ